MMKSAFVLFTTICLLPQLLVSQVNREPGRHLPKPTPKGEGKIDTRIDNMRYWRRMADSGFVYLAPMESVPPATFTGSKIESPMLMFVDSPDVPTTTVSSTQSENSVFVNPTNNLLVLNSNNSTTNPFATLYGADYLISSDGGATWGGSVNGAGGSNSGDPAAVIGLSGRQFINFINSPGGQGIAYSDNNGSSWSTATIAPNPGSLADKNHMWIDNKATSPYEGYLYAAWTDFGGVDDTEIKISRSTNDGISWSAPINISSAINAGSHNQGVNIQTGPDGEVYVIWAIYDSWPSDETSIGFAKSTDGGATFAPASRIISNIRGIRTTETSKNHRVNSFPSMAVDISGGPDNGSIYIVWTNIGIPGINTGNDIDIYMIKSTNEGSSWSTPMRINQDTTGQSNEHYFPWITCDRVSGSLSVIFYDDRNVSSTQCEAFVATSGNGGIIWEDFKVSDVAFTPAPIPGLASGYMGDYLGIASVDNRVYPVWTDNRSGTTKTYTSPFEIANQPIAFYSASTTTPCQNQTVDFQDQSTQNPTSWLWTITPSTVTFVNSTGQNSQNPQVQFNAFGNYTVRLIVANSYGADTLLKNNYITVNEANAEFIANDINVMINTDVIFTDQSTCNITSWNWNFGTDATPATASTQGPHTISYSAIGLKTVSLTVNGSITETKTNYINVLPYSFNMSNSTLTTCTGIFYDPQGTSDYLNNLDYTMTLIPGDTSKSIQAVFTLFDLEAEQNCIYDYLQIYDGTSTSTTLLGTWCGTSSPGTIIASNAAGALTFRFHSDQSAVGQGWAANISCVDSPPPPPPSYCSAGSSFTNCDEYISRVQVASINNSTGCSSPGGYGNHTSLLAKVSPTVSYPITVTNGKTIYPEDQCGIWVDWNHDYDFSDAGETITVIGTPGIGPYTANIIPPENASKGNCRLRVRITYTGIVSPCGITQFGEVEDYHLYVGTPGLWAGGTPGSETSWNNPHNWDDGLVPGSNTSVVIPDGLDFYPEVTGSFNCLDMEIKDGAVMNIETGAVLNLNGNLVIGQNNSGILIIDGGMVNVTGTITAKPGSAINLINNGLLNDN